MWSTVATDEYEAWFESLTTSEAESVLYAVALLRYEGPTLGRPFVDTIKGSKLANLKELRVPKPPIRIFFAFDPTRTAVLLIGGDKANDKRFYERMIPLAEALYARRLAQG